MNLKENEMGSMQDESRALHAEEEEEEEEEDFRLTGGGEGEEVIGDEDEEGDVPMDDGDADGDAVDEATGAHSTSQQTHQFSDTSIAAFYSHRQSIFSISLHPLFPRVPLALTGGGDDKGRIWNTRDGEEVVRLDGHEDSVTCTAWNAEGSMAAIGGMDGRVRVWRARPSANANPNANATQTQTERERERETETDWNTWEFLTNLEGPDEVTWLSWHPKGNVLTAGGADATVWMWQLPSGNVMQVFSGHAAGVSTGTWTPDGKKLATVSEDGSLIVWDPRSGSPLGKMQSSDTRFPFSSGITSLCISSDGKVLLVGGAEGDVRLVNIAAVELGGGLNVVGELVGHASGESIEGSSFVDLSGNAALGVGNKDKENVGPPTHAITVSTEGKGIVWDLSSGKMRCEVYHSTSTPTSAITALCMHPGTTLFSTSSAEPDCTIKTWEARTGACISTQYGFTDSVLAMDIGRDDGFTQGKDTGGLGDHTDLENARGWKIVAVGDEGVALVFRV